MSSITELGKIGEQATGGRTRLALSSEDFQGRRYLRELMHNAGLEVSADEAGNILGWRAGNGSDSRCIAMGSHIDTVPNAGALDGCYGVLAAVEVARTLNENNVSTERPLLVISFSNEEGVRFPMMTGSRVACGATEVRAALAEKDQGGMTYGEALAQETDLIGKRVPAALNERIDAWLELHIEQGPVLESEKLRLGVVEAIVGLRQFWVTFVGKAGHAGTTPMDLRQDPMLAASELALEVSSIARRFGSTGTVGFVKPFPGAFNVIAERTEVSVDLRNKSNKELERMTAAVLDKANEAASKYRLEIAVTERANQIPRSMSPRVADAIRRSADELGVGHREMVSGAVHDTMNMARIADCGMVFVPSKGGLSHAPGESTSEEDLVLGAEALLRSVLALSQRVL